MANEITRKQMVELLESEKHTFSGGPKWRDNSDLPYWMKSANEDIERRNAIIDAILAALEDDPPNRRLAWAVKEYLEWGPMTCSDRDLHEARFREALAALAGPSEEERKKMLKYLEELYTEDHPPQEHYDALYKFILSNRGGAVTEKFIEKWAAVFNDKYKFGNTTVEWEPKSLIRKMLCEAGVAGKEGR